MSIHFISGKPGGGKSMYGVKLILEELTLGRRTVITNLPLRVGEVNRYIQEHTEKAVDVVSRVWILDDDQTAQFWTFRPGGVRIPKLTADQWARGQRPSYADVSDDGVMYVIDEVHNFFGARQWAETGRDVLFYLSQHRKLGDTVVCITQAIGNVDKQFRSVTQDFTFLRNLSKEKYGFLRLPSIFIRKTFSSPPSDTTQPMETGTFRLDTRGIGALYDSAAGVGIHGRAADTAERKKGGHWSLFFVGLAILVVVVFFALPDAIGSMFLTPQERAGGRLKPGGSTAVVPAVSSSAPVPAVGSAPVLEVPRMTSNLTSTNTWIQGMTTMGGRLSVWLTDGRELRWPGEITDVRRDSVTAEGVRYVFRPSSSR